MLLKGQVAIVTGASRGMGKAIALTLAGNGANVIVNGNNLELLNGLAEEISALGQRCIVVQGNVADPHTAEELAESAISEFGRIDVLVNNAGINMRSSTLDMKIDEWKKVMDVNLNGTLYCCQAVLPHMIEQKSGKIVNVSSSTSKTPHRISAPSYGASKAGVNYLTQHLAFEMAKHGIHVNAICPGPIETDMSKQWSPEYRQQLLSRIPLGRVGTTQNIADAVLFLASRMSDFITGETINMNGGTYMN